jgi:hypothetical protein
MNMAYEQTTNDRNFDSITTEQRLLGRMNGQTNEQTNYEQVNERSNERPNDPYACVGVGE